MDDIQQLQTRFEAVGYVTEADLAATLLLMEALQRPLLLEGDAGVGKTEIAKVLAKVNDCPLIRLQCYEGLDVNAAVYEWNYQRQLLAIKIQEAEHVSAVEKEQHIFSRDFLLPRPLLNAITQPESPVLLIDEIDRADDEFEAYLLEVLSDFQVSIPELGTIQASSIPRVILTSNGTRELSDALRRRCLYHYIDYPDFDKEMRILHKHLPNIDDNLSGQIVEFVQKLRKQGLRKQPGIAETLDWAAALMRLDISDLNNDADLVLQSLSTLLKTQEDRTAMTPKAYAEMLVV